MNGTGASGAGWIDLPNPRHSCYDEMPKHLTREDWQRRWRCSCGRLYRVADSQRDGYYFEPQSAQQDGPHSRSCGIAKHDHGSSCRPDCPTCHGLPPASSDYPSSGAAS